MFPNSMRKTILICCVLVWAIFVSAGENKTRTGRQYVFEDAIVRHEYSVSDPPPLTPLTYQYAPSGVSAPVYTVKQPEGPPPPGILPFQSSQFSLPGEFYSGGSYRPPRPQSSGYSPGIPSYHSGGPIQYSYQPYYYSPPSHNTVSSSGDLHSSILSSLLASGYKPGKPPSSSYGWGTRPSSNNAFSSASASAGGSSFGLPSSAFASASSHSQSYGWRPGPQPPSPQPSPSRPVPTDLTGTIPPTQSFGWGPALVPAYPTRPVPEFTQQFSLRPSAFGWETSYNVPCGNYKIQPRVIAHLRLATQAVLPKPPPPKSLDGEDEQWREEKSFPQEHDNAHSYLDPFHLERSLHYSPYGQKQFSHLRPTFRPRTCRWNFNAIGGCLLNFKCEWFQLPALFRCDENYLHVSDSTLLLNNKFCGNRRPRRIYSSSSGKLALTFKSEGAALPAIFDCTVLCTPEESPTADLKTSPAPTELSPDNISSGSGKIVPVVAEKQTQITQAPLASENKKNTTIIIKAPSKPQLRMGNCKCGVPDSHYPSKAIHGRIVGGSSMFPGESPWTAALVKKNSNRPYCGASLLNSRYLLTAGHCVLNQTRKTRENGIFSGENRNGTNPDEGIHFDILLNEHDISKPNEIAGGTIRAKVDRVIVHPRYDNVTFDFDAALVRLAEPVEFNPVEGVDRAGTLHSNAKPGVNPFLLGAFDFHSLKRKKSFVIPEVEARAIPPKPVPICLPDLSERSSRKDSIPAPDDFALVTGWGLTAEGGIPSNEMLKARVQIFNGSTCQELYKKHNYIITDRMVCAGYLHGNTDSCVGDSGSPLAMEHESRFVLTGVVSWGRGCGRKQLPGVYTRVTELMDWIHSEAAGDDAVWCS